MTDPEKHSLTEDAQGIVYGATMAAFGIVILTHLGLVTGQTAGLAVLISYATGWGFGPVFFVINLPFYVLGYLRMGPVFTVKTFIAVALLSGLSLWLPGQVSFAVLNPWVGAVFFGFLSGSALLALFRHGASLGGIGIVALMLQDRLGWRAGWVQLGFDAVLFTVAFTMIEARLVIVSFLGALVVNLVIAINHRRDRYVAA
ncbi:MAG: YitT family protein [Rhodobacter sp.]|nr:YitT family protein [Rhodobacter sp.]